MNATMSSQGVLLATLAFGLAAALLAWSAIRIASNALARYHERFTAEAHLQLEELFLFMDPARLFVLNLLAVTVGGIGTWLASGEPLFASAAAFALALLPRFAFGLLRRRRRALIEQQLPDALQVIAGGLRSGVSMTVALQQLVREGRPPIAQEFDLTLREHRLGIPLDEALDHLAERVRLPSLTLVVAAMRIVNETGGSLAEALERAALTVRSQLAMEGKIGALTAQGKLQAVVVGMLPLALLLVLDRMEPEAMEFLWHSPPGWATLAVLATLEVLGVLLIRRIVAIDV